MQNEGERCLATALRKVFAAGHYKRPGMKLSRLGREAGPGNIPFVDFPAMPTMCRGAEGTRDERAQCCDHHWCHLCRLYQVGAGFAGPWIYLHRDCVLSGACQGTLALSGLDRLRRAREGYPCEAGPTCFALSN